MKIHTHHWRTALQGLLAVVLFTGILATGFTPLPATAGSATLTAAPLAAFESGQMLAMGGNRDSAALAPRGTATTTDGSMAEQMLGGSFTGAMLFGYPYTGVGTADMVLLVTAAFLILRVIAERKRTRPANRSSDKFEAGHWPGKSTGSKDSPDQPRDRTIDLGQRDVPRPRDENNAPHGGGNTPNPRDNAWTRRMGGPATPGSGDSPWNSGKNQPYKPNVKDAAAAMWAHLSSKEQAEERGRGTDPRAQVENGAHVPAGFDVVDFLEGARMLYIRLQNAWAARELDSLESFVSEDMMRALRSQAAGGGEPSTVDILQVNASLRDVEQHGGNDEALVHFNALMRMGGDEEPAAVDEVWRFSRNRDTGGTWRLMGIDAA